MKNARYRDLFQAMIMVRVDYFILAFAKEYKYSGGRRKVVGCYYQKVGALAQSLCGNHRVQMPRKLIILAY